jgi:hypothetical protein
MVPCATIAVEGRAETTETARACNGPPVYGRYAAFVIGTSLRLERLTWLDATGKAFASTTSLPLSGYTQFQP